MYTSLSSETATSFALTGKYQYVIAISQRRKCQVPHTAVSLLTSIVKILFPVLPLLTDDVRTLHMCRNKRLSKYIDLTFLIRDA